VGHPAWGFRLRVPTGWKIRHDAGGAILGHDSVVGIVAVSPHRLADMPAVRRQMMQGLTEQGLQLRPVGPLHDLPPHAVAADYEGERQGEPLHGHGVGTCGPWGGGAFILAVSTPQAFSDALASAADALATGMRFAAPDDAADAHHLAGTWVNTSSNTQTRYTLHPDGSFRGSWEASYSGNRPMGGGTDWGLARQDCADGSWTAQGTREQGLLLLRHRDGRQESVPYRVHVERGELFWDEYWFGDELYARR